MTRIVKVDSEKRLAMLSARFDRSRRKDPSLRLIDFVGKDPDAYQALRGFRALLVKRGHKIVYSREKDGRKVSTNPRQGILEFETAKPGSGKSILEFGTAPGMEEPGNGLDPRVLKIEELEKEKQQLRDELTRAYEIIGRLTALGRLNVSRED